jgi:RNA-directed DNA polymerase
MKTASRVYKRNELRQAMYYIQKFGIDEHQYREINQRTLEHLLGRINFVLQINPTEFIKYKSFLIDLKRKIF